MLIVINISQRNGPGSLSSYLYIPKYIHKTNPITVETVFYCFLWQCSLWLTTYILCYPLSVPTVGSVLKILRVSSCVLIFSDHLTPVYLNHNCGLNSKMMKPKSVFPAQIFLVMSEDAFIHFKGISNLKEKCVTLVLLICIKAVTSETMWTWNSLCKNF